MILTAHFHLMLRFKICGAIPPCNINASVFWYFIKHRNNSTFLSYKHFKHCKIWDPHGGDLMLCSLVNTYRCFLASYYSTCKTHVHHTPEDGNLHLSNFPLNPLRFISSSFPEMLSHNFSLLLKYQTVTGYQQYYCLHDTNLFRCWPL